MKLLKELNLKGMFFGIETLYLPTGRLIGKGFDPEKQIAMLQHIRQTYGNEIHTTGSFIAGLPGESVASIEKTQQRLLSREIPLHEIQFWPLSFDDKKFFYWQSSLSLNFEKFGYSHCEDSIPGYVGWKSAHMDWKKAHELVQDWINAWQSAKPKDIEQWYNNDGMGPPSSIVNHYKQQLFEYLKNVQS